MIKLEIYSYFNSLLKLAKRVRPALPKSCHGFFSTVVLGFHQPLSPIKNQEISIGFYPTQFARISIPKDPGSPNLRMVSWNLNTLRFVEVIGHPNHHLTR